ncbi:MAG: TIR domain-containing protein [Proteobacteria bacterium]|nr:TIR domain-containing protein [Pseudomonadota bacterium]
MSARPTIPFLLDLLQLAMRKEASAVYVVPWMPPTLRIDERSVPLSPVAFAPEQSTLLVLDLLDEAHRAALDRSREIHFSFVLDEVGRFRVHAFRRHGQPAMTIRPYALHAPTPRQLALPALVCPLAAADRGLLLLASRSAGLRRDAAAALIEQRKRNVAGELALLEDASRFWHEAGRGALHQGLSAAAALDLLQRRQARTAAGQPAPPLAIAWGELRDGLLLEQVLRAAEHALCLLTLDADDPLAALQRLVTLSAEHGGPELLRRAALHLNAVLALRAVPAAAGGADLAATEALANSPELSATLAEGDTVALAELLRGRPQADEHLWALLAEGLVTPENAMRRAVDRAAFAHRVAAEVPRPQPDAATAPVTVDTGFADVFETSAPMGDPFDFAEAAARPLPMAAPTPDTQFDDVDWSGPDRQPPHPDAAQFHAYAPAAVAPGALATIDLWAALPAQADEVAAQARRAAGGPPPPPFGDTSFPAISVQLRIDGVLASGPAQRLAWTRRPERVRFLVPVAGNVRPGAHAARVRLAVDGLPIGELAFVLQITADAPSTAPAAAAAALEDMHAARRMLQSAYAAFAPADRDVVQDIARDLQAVAPGLAIFAEGSALRSGEDWRDRIEREMARSERLFLFWSAAAAESPWVDFEWRLMLRRRGLGAIDALRLDPPRRAPLPPELADLASEVRVPAAAQPAAPP